MHAKISIQQINDWDQQIKAIDRSLSVIEFDLDGTIITANQNFLILMGYCIEEIIGKHHSIFLDHEYAKSKEYNSFWTKINQEKKYFSEFKRISKSGKEIWLHGIYNLIYDIDNKPYKIIKYIHNIDDKKTIEQEYKSYIKRKEDQYELILRSMSVGLWDWDIASNELYWSQKFKDMLGICEKDFVPHFSEFKDRLHPDDKEETERKLFSHIENHTPYDIEYRLKHNKGHYIWIHAFGHAQWDENGKAIRMAGSVDDISDRKKIEEEKKQFILDLEISNHDLDEFAHIASHDIKEPIRGINNKTQFLKDDYINILDQQGIKKIDRIQFLCHKMERFINDLLTYSKIGKQDLAIKKVDLNEIIQQIIDVQSLKNLHPNVKINIPQKLPIIICDHIRISELFKNLITNAIKYNNKKEKIVEIGFEKTTKSDINSKYIFYVKDNGIGIDKINFDNIFRIFNRLNDEDEELRGSGVGLTFVKKIIERHHGKIWLESKIGFGTTFYFYIGEKNEKRDF